MRDDRVSGDPPSNLKRGPGAASRTAMNWIIAWTGQIGLLDAPKNTSMPCWRKGSVLLCFILRRITEGAVWLSIATSARFRCTAGLYSLAEGTVNSPARRKPKKPVQAVAHSIIESWSGGEWRRSHEDCRHASRSGVISSLEEAGGGQYLFSYWEGACEPSDRRFESGGELRCRRPT